MIVGIQTNPFDKEIGANPLKCNKYNLIYKKEFCDLKHCVETRHLSDDLKCLFEKMFRYSVKKRIKINEITKDKWYLNTQSYNCP